MKHQHYIPKSYIKNFAEKKVDKFFVEAIHKKTEKVIPSLSTTDICVNKNIYTIPETDGDKYALEKFYAKNVDEVYPEVYKLLTNPNIKYISKEDRLKIIYTTMSLYFRTPKFLNAHNEIIDQILDNVIQYADPKTGMVKYTFEGVKQEFHISDLEKVKKEERLKSKKTFLANHLQVWHEFVEFKLNDAISVQKIYGDIELITSDNPVIMRSVHGNRFNVFDPTNIIQLPLDRFHFLIIFPKTEKTIQNQIFRGDRDKHFALTSNLSVDENSDEWIFGYPLSVQKHLEDQKKYGAHTEENKKTLEDMKKKNELMEELLENVEQHGLLTHKVANKVKEIRKTEIFKDDPEFQKIINILAANGFFTV